MNCENTPRGVDLLARRPEFLLSLLEEGCSKATLVRKVGVSRSTVNRAIRDLESLGLVSPREDVYELTVSGRLLALLVDHVEETVADVLAAQQLLSALPATAPMAPDAIRGADVYETTEPTPHAPYAPIEDVLTSGDRLRGLTRAVVSHRLADVFVEQVTERDVDAELVVERRVARDLFADTPAVNDLLAADLQVLRRDTLPFGMLLSESGTEKLCLLIYDRDGTFRGVLVNETREAVAWGRAIYRTYRADAVDVTDDLT